MKMIMIEKEIYIVAKLVFTTDVIIAMVFFQYFRRENFHIEFR